MAQFLIVISFLSNILPILPLYCVGIYVTNFLNIKISLKRVKCNDYNFICIISVLKENKIPRGYFKTLISDLNGIILVFIKP